MLSLGSKVKELVGNFRDVNSGKDFPDFFPGHSPHFGNVRQAMGDKAQAHLWMDMEAFLFEGVALIPRPIGGLIQDLQRFPNFEKILCYQYSGIFNSPKARVQPGGSPTVVLYRDYLAYRQARNQEN